MITGLDLVTVYVSDQERALAFYRDRLGMEVRADAAFGDERWLEVAPHGSPTRLVLYTPPGLEERVGRSSVLVLHCEDAQAVYNDLMARGVAFSQPPTRQMWGLEAVCADPDGNTLVLLSS